MTLQVAILYFLFLFFGFKPLGISDKQRKQVQLVVEAYTEGLKNYCDFKGNEPSVLRSKLRELYDDPSNMHINDLNFLDVSNDEVVEDETWLDYLMNIDEKYHFGIVIDFSINYTDCIDQNFAIVSIDKNIINKGKINTRTEIIEVDLPSNEDNVTAYKIHEILAAGNYKGENNNVCSNLIRSNENDVELYNKKKIADNYYFELKEYVNAKNKYEEIYNKKPNDAYIKKQLELCTALVNKADYQKKADDYFNEKDFTRAKYWYEKLQQDYSNQIDKNLINEKIKQARQGIIDAQYQKYMNEADMAFRDHDYSNARFNYQQALAIKPNDKYARQKFEESEVNDDALARHEIDRVIDLAKEEKNWGEYFRILNKYEGSINDRRFTTKQYINMVELLATFDKHVKEEMNFDRADFKAYLKIYTKKLNDALSWATNSEWIEEGNRLLKSVLKKRNQN